MAAVAPWWSNVATAVVLPARAARWRGVLPESGHYFIIICSSNGHILERNTKEIPETSIWSRESPSPDISSHSHPDIPSWKRIYHHIMFFRWTPDIQISRYPNIQISRYPDIPSWKRVSSYNVISMDGLFTFLLFIISFTPTPMHCNIGQMIWGRVKHWQDVIRGAAPQGEEEAEHNKQHNKQHTMQQNKQHHEEEEGSQQGVCPPHRLQCTAVYPTGPNWDITNFLLNNCPWMVYLTLLWEQ